MMALSILAWAVTLCLQWWLHRKYSKALLEISRLKFYLREAQKQVITLQKEANANKVRERFHVVK